MKKNILLSLLLTPIVAFAIDDAVIESLAMDDIDTFLVKKMNLTENEAHMSADALFLKGIRLYNKKGEKKEVKLKNDKVITYESSINKSKSMKYLVSSGLLGNPKASIVAINWLRVDTYMQGSKEYINVLSKKLHDDGYLYGTYTLGMTYSLGNGAVRNRDKALYYLGVVKDYCKSIPEQAYLSLSSNLLDEDDNNVLLKDGRRKCSLATSIYKHTKSTKYITKTPITDRKMSESELRKKLQRAMSNKQREKVANLLQGIN